MFSVDDLVDIYITFYITYSTQIYAAGHERADNTAFGPYRNTNAAATLTVAYAEMGAISGIAQGTIL